MSKQNFVLTAKKCTVCRSPCTV